MHDLLARLHAALKEEERWQRDEHARLSELAVQDQVAAGLTWFPVRVTDQDGPYVRIEAPRGSVLHDGIGSGDPVFVDGVRGLCLGVDDRAAELRVDDELANEQVAVTLRFDATTFVRYRQALEAVEDTPLTRALLEGEAGDPLEHGSWDLRRLDDTQREAAETALRAQHLALIHGPPGTGKTFVIAQLLRAMVAEGDRPWALADSNAAVDNLAVTAARAGLEVVRLGHPMRMGSEAAALSLPARIEQGSMAAALKAIDRDLSKLRSTGTGGRERWQLYQQRDQMREQARDAILEAADVLAVTFGTLARLAPSLPTARTAVIDEATQAIEPAIWVAVPWVSRLVMVGDPHQLGPVVKQPGNLLERSLLQRLLEEGQLPMPMLRTQRRMHTHIQSLVDEVYAGQLEAHATVASHRLCDLPGVAETPLTTRAVHWIDTVGAGFEQVQDPVTMSLYNEGEIAVIRLAVEALREAGVPAEAIGVIAPYSAQVARLRDAIEGVEVATVNAFQGREKEAILCTFVRSDDLGFVADLRRLTVALTRARRFLFCTGDSEVLSALPRFERTIAQAQALGGYVSVWEPPWGSVIG